MRATADIEYAARLFQSHLLDQSSGLGLVAAEADVELHRVFVTSLFEQLVAELVGHLAAEYALLLEVRECVGREHLGPLVAIISGCVAAAEYVRTTEP